MFTHGRNAIVTRITVSDDTRVIKHTGCKTGDAVAHTAILSSGNVRGGLPYGERAIVAGRTIAGYARVIENRREKRRR